MGVHLQVHPVQLHRQVNGELVGAGVGSVVQDALHRRPGVGTITKYMISFLHTWFEMSFPFCVFPLSQDEPSILDDLFSTVSISYIKYCIELSHRIQKITGSLLVLGQIHYKHWRQFEHSSILASVLS